MTSIPLLVGAALVFWGWHTGLWWLGLPLALLAEIPNTRGVYWELGVREQQRVADLCSILIVLAGAYLYLTQPRLGNAIILLVQWTPALLFPLLAVQLYGGQGGVELSVLFLSLRGERPGGDEQVDLRPPYLLVCLLAAAMLPPPSTAYYLALALIAIWVLWHVRPLGNTLWYWGGALLLALGLGYGIGLGLQRLQLEVEDLVVEWLAGYFSDTVDPYRAVTAIGEVGRLKQSERIVLRVWPQFPLKHPLLLRSASYNRYAGGTWRANSSSFQPLIHDPQGWHLPGTETAPQEIQIAMELRQGRGVLPLPNGSRLLQGLAGAQLSGNGAGVIKVLEGPSRAHYRVHYGAPLTAAAPDATDLQTPLLERPALDRLVQQMKLQDLSSRHALERLDELFKRDFRYSLQLEAPPLGYTSLTYFLLRRRSGHCEYFASAAVLLLRAAGIPARYVRGWSVQEYSGLEQAYLVRARHAHAWVQVWLEGAWHDFDPTPPDWGGREAEGRPWWGPVQDLWAWLSYRLTSSEDAEQADRLWLAGWLIPLVTVLVWRIARRGRRTARPQRTNAVTRSPATPFTSVEQRLGARAGPRHAGETLGNWLIRLQRQGEAAAGELIPALGLYYRHRFDPQGLERPEMQRLQGLLEHWRQRYGG